MLEEIPQQVPRQPVSHLRRNHTLLHQGQYHIVDAVVLLVKTLHRLQALMITEGTLDRFLLSQCQNERFNNLLHIPSRHCWVVQHHLSMHFPVRFNEGNRIKRAC